MSKYDTMYMEMAKLMAKQSHCPRKRVGAVVVTDSGMIAPGFNGHASGGPNDWPDTGVANPEVVHAELNALGKMLEQGVSAKGATIYCTASPCPDCAKLLVRAKVKRVVYLEKYRLPEGLEYLERYGVECVDFSDAAVFKRQWAGREFQCTKTDKRFVIPDTVVQGTFYNVGEGFVDVGRLNAYHRMAGVRELEFT